MSETIGRIIRRLRKAQNLTQGELAAKLNISSQAVSKWENGAALPDISQIVPLASVFGVSTDLLLGVEPKQSKNRRSQPEYPLWVMGLFNTDAYAHLYQFSVDMIPEIQKNMTEKSFLCIEYHQLNADNAVEVTMYWIIKDEVFVFRAGDQEACRDATLRICEKGIYDHVT